MKKDVQPKKDALIKAFANEDPERIADCIEDLTRTVAINELESRQKTNRKRALRATKMLDNR